MLNKIVLFFLILFLSSHSYGAYTWDDIIGVPQPSFGLDDTPTPPSSWTSEQAGNYYISASGCSDGRTYGYPGASRCTIPSSPAAGSKIWLNGTYSSNLTANWSGTAGSPIWILSYNPESKATYSGEMVLSGDYIYVVNVAFSASTNVMLLTMSGEKVTARSCTFANTYNDSNGALIYFNGSYVLVDGCTFSQNGIWDTESGSDIDRHGIKTGPGDHYWIVRSTFYHLRGDGVQVGDQSASGGQYVYVGKNTAYENCQSGFWTKIATDVVFSQNTVYDIKTICHDVAGHGIGGQYEYTRVWVLYNNIYNCPLGIEFDSGDGPGPTYIIGNVLNNITATASCNAFNYGAVHYRNAGGAHIYFNTFYNSYSGVTKAYNDNGVYVKNNIFAAHQGSCPVIDVGDGYTDVETDFNLFESDSYDIRNTALYSSISAYATATGYDSHRQVGSASFVNAPTDLSLQSNSPAIGNANTTEESVFATFETLYGLDIRKDFSGTSRPAAATDWDIGAYEYTAGIETTTIPGGITASGIAIH